jgi:hypothetical protein
VRRGGVAAALLTLAACGEHGRAPAPVTTSPPVTSAPIAAPSAPAASASAPAASASAPPGDPEEQILREAPIVALFYPERRSLLPRGTYQAVLGSPSERARPVLLSMALSADPIAYRRPLAFYRLARGLGARVVPTTVLRHVPVGDLAGVMEDSAEQKAILRDARVLNDGTVDVLLMSPASPATSGTPFDPEQAREARTWERWATSPAAVPGEDSGLLRDYVEMLVLDYLSANDARRQAHLHAGAGERAAIVLADNASAFPPHPEPHVLDRMLRRLRGVARFPRGMRDALLRFDRERAAAAFADGGFETWLLAPRVRVELDERRAALLTLLEARIGERGAEAVLCL